MRALLRRTLLCILLLTFIPTGGALADIVIIVHPDNEAAIDAKVVQRIFLGKEKKFSDGKETLPINQADKSASRGQFDSDVLGRNTNQVLAHWSKLVFTGKGIPPKEVDNDEAVVAIVADNKNAIGYVDRSAATNAVKIIAL